MSQEISEADISIPGEINPTYMSRARRQDKVIFVISGNLSFNFDSTFSTFLMYSALVCYSNLEEQLLSVYLYLLLAISFFSQVHRLYLTSSFHLLPHSLVCGLLPLSFSLRLTNTSVPPPHRPGFSAPIAITFHLLPFLPCRSPKWLCSACGGCLGPVNYARLSLRRGVQAN